MHVLTQIVIPVIIDNGVESACKCRLERSNVVISLHNCNIYFLGRDIAGSDESTQVCLQLSSLILYSVGI